MDNEGIFLRKMIKIVGEADTIIVNCPLSIVNYYRSNGTINWDLLVNGQLSIVHCPLSIVHCPLLIARYSAS